MDRPVGVAVATVIATVVGAETTNDAVVVSTTSAHCGESVPALPVALTLKVYVAAEVPPVVPIVSVESTSPVEPRLTVDGANPTVAPAGKPVCPAAVNVLRFAEQVPFPVKCVRTV